MKTPALFGAHLATNCGLVALGYQAAMVQTPSHRLILLVAFAIGVAAALIWSRTLARSYAREDRATATAEHLLNTFHGDAPLPRSVGATKRIPEEL